MVALHADAVAVVGALVPDPRIGGQPTLQPIVPVVQDHQLAILIVLALKERRRVYGEVRAAAGRHDATEERLGTLRHDRGGGYQSASATVSISTIIRGSISAETSTIVISGFVSP